MNIGCIKKYRVYIYTLILTSAALMILAFSLKSYPFGDNTFLWADSDQYMAINSYFGTLLGKNDIFYSWSNVLGGNAMPLLAYYSFSPFNVLFIIFQKHFIFATHLVTYSKIVISAVSFCYCLNTISLENNLIKILLSFSYAFMGYSIFYAWNASWLDGVILLPLVFVGIKKIVHKQNPGMYIISLSLAIISNFYIGYMLCLASIMFYVSMILLNSKKIVTNIKRTFGRYMFSSIISGGLSAFILLPAYLGLPQSRKLDIVEILKDMRFNESPSTILSGLFSGQINTLYGNAPLIYVGVLPLVLSILYFVNKKISVKYKLVYSTLLLVLIFSFENSAVNIAWHGFSQNAWFNYRYSFIFSFILLVIAFNSGCNLSTSLDEYLKTFIILICFIAIVLNESDEKISPAMVSLDFICVCLIIAGLYSYRKYKIIMSFLYVQVFICTILNANWYLKDYCTLKISNYANVKAIFENARNVISDDNIYRMDKSFRYGSCDASLFDYKGVTNYASTENVSNLKYLKSFGIKSSLRWGEYTPDLSMAAESLLGLKYILTDSINSKDYIKIGEYNNVGYYKNLNVLPILFLVQYFNNDVVIESNGFLRLNLIWNSINGFRENVFEENTKTKVKQWIEGDSNYISITFTTSVDGSAYIFFPDTKYEEISILEEGNKRDISYSSQQELYYIGNYREGDVFELIFSTQNMEFTDRDIVSYSEKSNIIEINASKVNKQNLNIIEKSSSHLQVNYSGFSRMIATTIPFDEGWNVYDNGEKIDAELNWNNFLCFRLGDSYEHKIELIYIPKGFKQGFILTMISVVLFVIYEFYMRFVYKEDISLRGKRITVDF